MYTTYYYTLTMRLLIFETSLTFIAAALNYFLHDYKNCLRGFEEDSEEEDESDDEDEQEEK